MNPQLSEGEKSPGPGLLGSETRGAGAWEMQPRGKDGGQGGGDPL